MNYSFDSFGQWVIWMLADMEPFLIAEGLHIPRLVLHSFPHCVGKLGLGWNFADRWGGPLDAFERST